MTKIEVISGEINIGTRMTGAGMIELNVINDKNLESILITTHSQKIYKKGNRINAVGQWRTIRKGNTKQLVFYAASVMHVQHLLDADESWLSDLDLTDLQSQQLRDGNCILQQIGVERELARDVSLRHQNSLLPTLITNPFKILEEEGGLEFSLADKFAKELGLAPTTPDRAAAGIRDIFKKHAPLNLAELKNIAINEYCLFWPVMTEILTRMENTGAIIIEKDQDGSTNITVNDLKKSITLTTAKTPSTGNIATDMLILRQAEDSFLWEEVVRTISTHTQSPIATTQNMVIVIDTSEGDFPQDLPGEISSLVERVGSHALHCSAVKPLNQNKTTAFERYLVGLSTEVPALVIIEDSHFLDFHKLRFLAQRLQKTAGLILMGDSTYNPKTNPLNLLISSRRVPTVKLNMPDQMAAACG